MQGEHPQMPPSKRRRTAYGGGNVRTCPHCGRNFKRTEHLERHVRTRKSGHVVSFHVTRG